MESKATLKNLGISTKKVRIPAAVVRGMNVVQALTTLQFMEKSAAQHVAKVIKSAAMNAQNKDGANLADLVIADIRIDKGNYRIKHYHPRAKGGGYYMQIRGKSHITVVLKDKNQKTEAKAKKVKEVKNETKTEEVTAEKKPAAKKANAAKPKKEAAAK